MRNEDIKLTDNHRRQIALLDKDGIVVGRVENPTEAQWDAAPKGARFEHGFDNALHRYKLVEWSPEKFRLEPVKHALDGAAENNKAPLPILAPLARAVLSLAGNTPTDTADIAALTAYLNTFDGAR